MTTPASTTQTTDVPAAPEPERDRATLDVASQTAEALSRQPLVNGLVSGAVIVAALYFGRDLLVPLALSILVGFVLGEDLGRGGVFGSIVGLAVDVPPVRTAGQLDAQVRVTYEDVNGNPTETLLPLNMVVNEEAAVNMASGGNGAMEVPGDTPANANIGWVFWALGGAAVVTGLVVLGINMKKKRERALEEE